jgi:carboxylesterase type B
VDARDMQTHAGGGKAALGAGAGAGAGVHMLPSRALSESELDTTDETSCGGTSAGQPQPQQQPQRPTSAPDLLPVMVWVHGGGYVFGSGNYPNYAPTADQAAAMGAVLVSFNYRLGALGWLATRELSADNLVSPRGSGTDSSGNYGYMDMVAALRWVRDNIRAFGGDPGRVTLYGQSAGGTATMALLAAPSAKGLFHRALMQSGSARYNTSLAAAERDNAYFLASAGCAGGGGVACLRAAPAATITNAVRWTAYPGWAGQGVSGFPIYNFSWGNLAIVDGHVIPRAPVDALADAALSADRAVPLIVGSTAQETDLFPLNTGVRNGTWAQYDALARRKMAPFGAAVLNATTALYDALYPRGAAGAGAGGSDNGNPQLQYTSLSSDIGVNCPNSAIARRIGAEGGAWRAAGAPLYRYVLTATPSQPMFMLGSGFPGRLAFHTLDSVYLFNTTRGAMAGARPSAADAALTRRLRRDLGEFVRTGEVSAWKKYPAVTMELGDAGELREIAGDYHAEACAFWEGNGFFNYSWAGN